MERKAIIIFGKEGSRKTTKAIEEAEKVGKYIFLSFKDIINVGFGLGPLVLEKPDAVIVAECPRLILDDHRIKGLITEDKLRVERKGKNPELVPNVKWIFTITHNRQLDIISV